MKEHFFPFMGSVLYLIAWLVPFGDLFNDEATILAVRGIISFFGILLLITARGRND